MPSVTVTTVLGESKEATRFYLDGSFDCPFCCSAVIAPKTQCDNPGCFAHPAWNPDSLRSHIAKVEAQREEEEQRKRNHELAMRRIKEEREAREAQQAREDKEVRELGQCLLCWVKAHKRVKHRAECPRERSRIYRDLGMKKVRGALGGVYYE